MTFTFNSNLNYPEAELISGEGSFQYANSEYLEVRYTDDEKVFRINFEYHCSPFKEAAILDNLLLVGHQEHFYVYDIKAKQNLLALKMEGYFGHLYVEDDIFFVADAYGLWCVNKQGKIVWRNGNLGIDGVLIEKLTNDKIQGSGEWDPPGGWKDFVVHKDTGVLFSST